MNRSIITLAARLLLAPALTAVASVTAADAANSCASHAGCTEVRTFTATVTNFRTSKQGANRLVTLTVRFQNKTEKPLTLGYVSDSVVIMDDKGNRYAVWGPGAVRAIGVVTDSSFDPKFSLQPQESGDARFELLWKNAGNTIAGTSFDLDLAVREIVPLAGDQLKLGQEHALHYGAINEGTLTAAAKPATAPAAVPGAGGTGLSASAAAPASATAPADPCAGASNCYNAGPFVAQVQQVTPALAGRHHTVKLVVRFTNLSSAPVVLGYKSGTNGVIDNFGNRYHWGRPSWQDGSAQGIGIVTSRSADPQFALNPGQSRTATFSLIRFEARAPFGTSFQYDVVIDELEILDSQQVRTVRENSLTFARLTAGNLTVAQAPGQLPGLADAVPGEGSEVAKKVIDLFNSIKKK